MAESDIDQRVLDAIKKAGPGTLKLSLDGEPKKAMLTLAKAMIELIAPFGIGKFVNVVIEAIENNINLQDGADTTAKFLRDDIEKCLKIIDETEANLLDIDADVAKDYSRVVQSFLQILEGIYACCMNWKECSKKWNTKARKAKEYNGALMKFRNNLGNDKSNLILVMFNMQIQMDAKQFKLTEEQRTLLRSVDDNTAEIVVKVEATLIALTKIEGTTDRTELKVDEILDSQREMIEVIQRLKPPGSDSTKPIIVLVTVTEEETNGLHHAFMGEVKVSPSKSGKCSYFDLSGDGEYRIFHIVSEKDDAATQNPVGEAIDHWKPKACISVGMAFGMDREDQKIKQVLVATDVVKYTDPQCLVTCSSKLVERVQTANDEQKEAGSSGWPKIRFGRIVCNNTRVEDNVLKRKFPSVIGFERGAHFSSSAPRRAILILCASREYMAFLMMTKTRLRRSRNLRLKKLPTF